MEKVEAYKIFHSRCSESERSPFDDKQLKQTGLSIFGNNIIVDWENRYVGCFAQIGKTDQYLIEVQEIQGSTEEAASRLRKILKEFQ